MLYNFLFPLADDISVFNLFRYITLRTGGATVTALFVSFVLGPMVIRWLKSKQAEGQPHPRRRPPVAPDHQEGYAHHGRRADPVRAGDRNSAVGRPDQ